MSKNEPKIDTILRALGSILLVIAIGGALFILLFARVAVYRL